jgi:hypothetical protein
MELAFIADQLEGASYRQDLPVRSLHRGREIERALVLACGQAIVTTPC